MSSGPRVRWPRASALWFSPQLRPECHPQKQCCSWVDTGHWLSGIHFRFCQQQSPFSLGAHFSPLFVGSAETWGDDSELINKHFHSQPQGTWGTVTQWPPGRAVVSAGNMRIRQGGCRASAILVPPSRGWHCWQETMLRGQRPALMTGVHGMAFSVSWASSSLCQLQSGLGLLPLRPPVTSDPTSHRTTLPLFCVP